jgi:hypothetical protein
VDDAETQNPADSSVNHTAGVKHVSAVFVPSDPRLQRVKATATLTVFSPTTQIVIPDGYVIDGIYGQTLADISGSGQTLDTLLRLKGFRAVAVDGEGMSQDIEGTFTWLSPSVLLSAAGGVQEAALVFTPKSLMADPTQAYDSANPSYVASQTKVNVTLAKAPLTGSVTLTGKTTYGQTLTADVNGLGTTPDISETVGMGDLTYVWKRHNNAADTEGTVISGAGGASYVLTAADIGKKISVTVTAANASGSRATGLSDTVGKASQSAPAVPVFVSKSSTQISVEAVDGLQYSIDYGTAGSGATWQDGGVFTALSPATTYTVYARRKATDVLEASPASSGLTVKTDRALTYTAAQVGGTDGVATTTEIRITFSEALSGLAAANITLIGDGVSLADGTLAPVAGSGNTVWKFNVSGTFPNGTEVSVRVQGLADTEILTGALKVTLYRDVTAPVVSDGSAVRTNATVATVGFTTSEAGDAYVLALTAGVDAPAAARVVADGKALGAVVAGAVSGQTVTVAKEAQDLYLVVRDAAGNLSAAVKIELEAYDGTPPVLSGGSAVRTGATAGTVSFKTDEGGTAYYVQLAPDAGAPAGGDVVSGGTSLGTVATGSVSGKAVTLDTGVRYVYVVVRDKAGNVSEPLRIVQPAYDNLAPVLTAGKVNRKEETSGTLSFTLSEDGEAKYLTQSGGAAPTAESVLAGGRSLGYLEAGTLAGLPVTFAAGDTKVYVAVRDGAGNASNVLAVDIPALAGGGADTVAPVVSAGSVNRLSSVAGTLSFKTDEAGSAHVYVQAAGKKAPSAAAVGAQPSIGSVASGDVVGKAITLAAGAQDVYVVVKDAAGNVSNLLVIEVPDFGGADETSPRISDGYSNRISSTSGTVSFSTDEAGTAFVLAVAAGAVAPSAADIESGGASLGTVAAGPVVGKAITVTEGAKDLYVVLRDAAGNRSNVLCIPMAAAGDAGSDVRAPWLSGGLVNRTSSEAGSISFYSDEAGEGFVLVQEAGAAVPDAAAVLSADSIGIVDAGFTGAKAVALTAGAKDIYVVVRDAAGNASNVLLIYAAAYTGKDVQPPQLSNGHYVRTSDTAATIGLDTDEGGSLFVLALVEGTTPVPGAQDVIADPSVQALGPVAAGSLADIPVEITDGAQDVYVVIRDAAGNASAVLLIRMTDYDGTAPVVTAVGSNRTSDGAGTVRFTTDESGEAYYVVSNDAAASPVADAVAGGRALGQALTGGEVVKSVNLTAGEQYVFVVVKDATGNVSAPVRFTLAAFAGTDTQAPVVSGLMANRYAADAAAISLTTDEGGEAYYVAVPAGTPVTQPAAEDLATARDGSGSGTPWMVLGEVPAGTTAGLPIAVDSGATDVYVVVRDAAGNISDMDTVSLAAWGGSDTQAPALLAGAVTRTGATGGVLSFKTDEAGAAFVYVADGGLTAPDADTVEHLGVPIGAVAAGNISGVNVALTPGKQDVFVLVKDAAGNVSNVLFIPVAAYSADAGDGYTYAVLSPNPMTWTGRTGSLTAEIDGDSTKFARLLIGTAPGAESAALVPGTDYTVAGGSTVITLNESWLGTLAPGTYWLVAVYESGAGASWYADEIQLIIPKADDSGGGGGGDTPGGGGSSSGGGSGSGGSGSGSTVSGGGSGSSTGSAITTGGSISGGGGKDNGGDDDTDDGDVTDDEVSKGIFKYAPAIGIGAVALIAAFLLWWLLWKRRKEEEDPAK